MIVIVQTNNPSSKYICVLISVFLFLQVRQVRLFQDEEIYSDLYLTVCEWPSDSSKVIVFGFKYASLVN